MVLSLEITLQVQLKGNLAFKYSHFAESGQCKVSDRTTKQLIYLPQFLHSKQSFRLNTKR